MMVIRNVNIVGGFKMPEIPSSVSPIESFVGFVVMTVFCIATLIILPVSFMVFAWVTLTVAEIGFSIASWMGYWLKIWLDFLSTFLS